MTFNMALYIPLLCGSSRILSNLMTLAAEYENCECDDDDCNTTCDCDCDWDFADNSTGGSCKSAFEYIHKTKIKNSNNTETNRNCNRRIKSEQLN